MLIVVMVVADDGCGWSIGVTYLIKDVIHFNFNYVTSLEKFFAVRKFLNVPETITT